VIEYFGESILDSLGVINRKVLGQQIFADLIKRRALEAIIHPYVFDSAKALIENMLLAPVSHPLIIFDIPLFFEVNENKNQYRAVILVLASREQSIQRVMKRNNCSAEEAEIRYQCQINVEDKAKLADFVIDNSGNIAKLEQQVSFLYDKLKRN
jgi:dephospho-CoA kinase